MTDYIQILECFANLVKQLDEFIECESNKEEIDSQSLEIIKRVQSIVANAGGIFDDLEF